MLSADVVDFAPILIFILSISFITHLQKELKEKLQREREREGQQNKLKISNVYFALSFGRVCYRSLVYRYRYPNQHIKISDQWHNSLDELSIDLCKNIKEIKTRFSSSHKNSQFLYAIKQLPNSMNLIRLYSINLYGKYLHV